MQTSSKSGRSHPRSVGRASGRAFDRMGWPDTPSSSSSAIGRADSTSSIWSTCSTLTIEDLGSEEQTTCTVRIAQRRLWRNCVNCGDMFNQNDTLAAADLSVSVGKEYASRSCVATGICDGCYIKLRRRDGQLPQLGSIDMSVSLDMTASIDKNHISTPAAPFGSSCDVGGRGCAKATLQLVHDELLNANSFVQQKYNKVRANCLTERAALGAGNSAELKLLYKFWAQFLVTNFNKRMYADFKRLAIEDYRAHCYFGMECLFEFYSSSLEKKLRPVLLADFHELALAAHSDGHLCGLQQLFAFLRNRSDPMSLALLDGLGTKTVSAVGTRSGDCQWGSHKRLRAHSPVPVEPRQIRRFGVELGVD